MKLAIIGAGIAGLTCARQAAEAGHEVTVFDKGRGPGGRCSTRRMESPLGDLRFDHGTMGFKTGSKEFSDEARIWLNNGWIALWEPRIARLDKQGLHAQQKAEKFCVGMPGMNGLVRGLTNGLDVRFGVRIHALKRTGQDWVLTFEDDTPDFTCDGVVSAVPAEQASVLLADPAPELSKQAADVSSLPCWTVMAAYDAPLSIDFDLILGNGSPFNRLIRNASKPERDAVETWVIQAGPDWSASHVDLPPEDIISELLSAFQAMTNTDVAPVVSAAHRWLYAFPSYNPGVPATWDEELQIGTCGDWHISPEVEGAWLSGRVLGERLKSLS